MIDFTIKRGDRSPSIVATLEDRNGAAVDLTGKTVKFHMRSLLTGELLVNAAASIVAPATGGVVKYDWQAADTDEAGYALGEWEVLLSAGVTQTYPTEGWHLISITEDLDTPNLTDAEFLAIQQVRTMVAEPTSENYSDSAILALVTASDDQNLAAAMLWEAKAASYSTLVDISESGSSRSMGDLYKNALTMAKFYRDLSTSSVTAITTRPRTRRIMRADAQ